MRQLKHLSGKLPVYVALLILSLSAMWFVKSCSHSSSAVVASAVDRPGGDTLAIAIEMSPLTYAFSGDTVVGLDYELASDICRIHHRPVVFFPFSPLNYAFDGLRSGRFDVVIANIPATSDLRTEFATTKPIFTDHAVLVQKSTADTAVMVTATHQLAGDTVWIAHGSPLRTRLENLAREMGDTIHIASRPEYTAEVLCILVEKGELRKAVVTNSMARRMKADYPDLDISLPVGFSQFQTWIVRPTDTELLDQLNSWLDDYSKTAAYRRLLNKYLD